MDRSVRRRTANVVVLLHLQSLVNQLLIITFIYIIYNGTLIFGEVAALCKGTLSNASDL